MKYVMFENLLGHKLPVIFAEDFVHVNIADAVMKMVEDNGQLPVKPVSAGFITVDAKCSGRSESLNMEVDVHDETYILYNDSLRTVPEAMIPGLILELEENRRK